MKKESREFKSVQESEKLRNKKQMIFLSILALLFILSFGLSLAYFTSSANVKGVSFSFAKLETLVSANGQEYGKDIAIEVDKVASGAKLVESVSVKVSQGSINGFMRVKVDYEGLASNQVSQNVAIALNSDLSFNTYENSAGGYKWVKYNGYYYLTDLNGKLKECESGKAYSIFAGANTVYFPDVSKYNLEVVALNDVNFCVKAEAVQSSSVKDEVKDIEQLDSLIEKNNIFDAEETIGYIVRFNTLSEYNVNSIIVRDGDVTLPQVSGINVEWYDSFSQGVYGTKVGDSGDVILNGKIKENKMYYAKYSQSKITVLFESDGAEEGTLPNSLAIEYSTSGYEEIAVTSDLVKTGYTYSKWTTTVNNASIDFAITNGKIQVAKNIAKAGDAITIKPKWEIITYTAIFITNGATLSQSGFSYDANVGGYKTEYNVATEFVFPNIEKTESAFMGWEVTNTVAGSKWRVEDKYIAGKIGKGYTGNVTFTAKWSELAFKESASGDAPIVGEVSKAYGDDNFTIYLSNTTGAQAVFTSSNESVAKVIDANYGTVKIVGIGNCEITASVQIAGIKSKTSYTLNVSQRSIAKAIVASIANQTYTGSAIEVKPQITDLSATLVESKDYTLSYTNNKNVGTATITITGKGNYTGTKTATFKIVAKDITNAEIKLSAFNTYNGKEQTQGIESVKVGDLVVNTYTVTNNKQTNANTYKLTVTGTGNFTGSASVEYKINARNISNATISTIGNQTYTGSAITSSYSVTDSVPSSGTALKSGTDYTGAFTSNTNVGTATLTITGKGNYTGTKTATFKITNAVLTGNVTQNGTLTYSGSAQTPKLNLNVVAKGGQKITYTYATSGSGTYSATVPTYTNKGTYTLYWKATATYHNELKGSCTITVVAQGITKPTASGTYTYNGKSQTVSIATNAGYTISGNTGTNAGTYTAKVVLKDKANTTWADGTTTDLSLSWKINARSISSSEISITVNPSSYTYKGSAITPTYTVKDSLSTINKNLTSADYTGASKNNTNVGTATLTVTGRGNYTGTKTATFTIVKASVTVPSSPVKSYTYTGSAISHGYTAQSGTSIVSSGTTASATNVGTYNIVLAIDSNHIWSDNTTTNKTVTWKITAKQLTTVTGLSWSGGTASWSSVSNANKYSITLYKNGAINKTVEETTSTSYNFASSIQTAATIWTFKVTAVSTSNNYSNSAQSGASSSQTTYSITYNANSGSGAPGTQYKIKGVNITLSSTKPTRSGYTFNGWGTSSGATSVAYNPGATYTGNANLALYAVWGITLTVVDTSSYYYSNGSLYSKSNRQYYKCSYCNGYSTSSNNSTGCTGHSHSYSKYGYYCATCGYTTSASHINHNSTTCTTCLSTCSTCKGTGQVECTYNEFDGGTWLECRNGTVYVIDDYSGDEAVWGQCDVCGGDGYVDCGICKGTGKIGDAGKITCSTCNGNGKCDYSYDGDDYIQYCKNGTLIEEYGADVYSVGQCPQCKGSGKCTTCGGTGKVTCSTCGGDGLMDTTTNHTTVAYKCSTCGNMSTSNNGTGCKHNYSLVGYLYTRKYGTGSSSFYSTETISTGYYWHSTYGALKKGSTFTYSDGYTYEVTNISGTTLTARRRTS